MDFCKRRGGNRNVQLNLRKYTAFLSRYIVCLQVQVASKQVIELHLYINFFWRAVDTATQFRSCTYQACL